MIRTDTAVKDQLTHSTQNFGMGPDTITRVCSPGGTGTSHTAGYIDLDSYPVACMYNIRNAAQRFKQVLHFLPYGSSVIMICVGNGHLCGSIYIRTTGKCIKIAAAD